MLSILYATAALTACHGACRAEDFRLSGFVRNAGTREVIRHANLSADGGTVQQSSDADGFYFLKLSSGLHRLRIRAIGFTPLDTTLEITANLEHDFVLAPRPPVLDVVTVSASAERPDLDPHVPDMGVIRMDLATSKDAPALLGEKDPIRSLALLPGVSTLSDASTAFSVRGGSADQNLVLLDESTIYNPTHVVGFLSAFNSDAIDDITLYKGSIPARFGSRLASVVDIRQRDGNANNFDGTASIGLLSSRATLEGPIPVVGGSYMLAGRRSYIDLIQRALPDTALHDNLAYFYDLNAKATVPLGKDGSLSISRYGGQDRFRDNQGLGIGWGNRATSVRWSHVFGGRLYSKVTLASSRYAYQLGFPVGNSDSVTWVASIASADAKVDETLHFTERNSLEFGAERTAHRIAPGDVTPNQGSALPHQNIEARRADEYAAYLGHEIDPSQRWSLRYGLRLSAFDRLGAATIYRYADGAPLVFNSALARFEPGVAIDSTTYKSGQRVAAFRGLEPRATVTFALSQSSSLKASYARTRQYLQLATKTDTPTPFDIWEPAGPFVQPQTSDQVAIGYSATSGVYETSLEAYARKAYDVVDFVDGADLILNQRLETTLLQGTGRARGIEFIGRKRTGVVTGWVSYTLSRAEERLPASARTDSSSKGGINGGAYFTAPSDRTHNLSIVAVYHRSSKWRFGSTFALASGLPTTLPQARYQIDDLIVAEYGPRNSSRLPLYHRLDLSATRTLKHGELEFGVYNAYDHFNAQSLIFRQKKRRAPQVGSGGARTVRHHPERYLFLPVLGADHEVSTKFATMDSSPPRHPDARRLRTSGFVESSRDEPAPRCPGAYRATTGGAEWAPGNRADDDRALLQ
jgi:hypothetical protein